MAYRQNGIKNKGKYIVHIKCTVTYCIILKFIVLKINFCFHRVIMIKMNIPSPKNVPPIVQVKTVLKSTNGCSFT